MTLARFCAMPFRVLGYLLAALAGAAFLPIFILVGLCMLAADALEGK